MRMRARGQRSPACPQAEEAAILETIGGDSNALFENGNALFENGSVLFEKCSALFENSTALFENCNALIQRFSLNLHLRKD